MSFNGFKLKITLWQMYKANDHMLVLLGPLPYLWQSSKQLRDPELQFPYHGPGLVNQSSLSPKV